MRTTGNKDIRQLTPLVSIIVPNFNGRQFIVRCLESVLATRYPSFEVIVVDDGSTDGSLELVKRRFGDISHLFIVESSVNRGAAATKNIGAKKADGDVLCFLDNDTEVDPDWLIHLLKTLFSYVDVGASQSLLLDYSRRDIIQVAGVRLVPYTCLAVPILQGWTADEVNLDAMEICGLSAALAVRRRVFHEVGGFDEFLAVYTEDLDFSWRVWLRGYRILLAPRSKVYHWTKRPEILRYSGFSSYDFNFHLAKNSIRSVMKNADLLEYAIYLPMSLLFHFARALLAQLKHRDDAAILGVAKGLLWNLQNLRDTFEARSKIQRTAVEAKVPSFFGLPLRGLSLPG